MNWRISDPAHLLSAMRIALVQGGQFLKGRIAPNGPIMRERSVSYIHKVSWGMFVSGVEHETIARLLDWVAAEALQSNGDFFFPEEPPEYKDFQRLYRPLNFCCVAAKIGHPLIENQQVVDRILQYQHVPSGGAFHYIGEDPNNVEEQESLGTLDTTFFGHLMIALDMRDRAIAAGDWVRRWVDLNKGPMSVGRMYTTMTPGGELIADIGPGEAITKVVDTEHPKQEFWTSGTAMAYLVDLYEVMVDQWGREEADARPYLDAALTLLDFETKMPLDTYLWLSKCKVGWGSGELIRVLVEKKLADAEVVEKAYRVAERVAIFTFLDNQRANGSWPWMHYPLADNIPEVQIGYKPLKDTVGAQPDPIEGSNTIWLSAEEITGEFLGEMKSIERGVVTMLKTSA